MFNRILRLPLNSKSWLTQFAQDYAEAKLHLLNLGKYSKYHGTIEVHPFTEVLQNLPKLLA